MEADIARSNQLFSPTQDRDRCDDGDCIGQDSRNRRAAKLQAGKAEQPENQNRIERNVDECRRRQDDRGHARIAGGAHRKIADHRQDHEESAQVIDLHVLADQRQRLRPGAQAAEDEIDAIEADDAHDAAQHGGKQQGMSRNALDTLDVARSQQPGDHRRGADADAEPDRHQGERHRKREPHGGQGESAELPDEERVRQTVGIQGNEADGHRRGQAP